MIEENLEELREEFKQKFWGHQGNKQDESTFVGIGEFRQRKVDGQLFTDVDNSGRYDTAKNIIPLSPNNSSMMEGESPKKHSVAFKEDTVYEMYC